ncbi:MAG: carbohydrate kinase family protein [Nitrospirae bacterium]|nr:carbohydrate kinase family protein [Nitrospirota bacterium]
MKISVISDIMINYKIDRDNALPIDCLQKEYGGTLFNISIACKEFFDEVIAIGIVGEDDYEAVYKKFIDNKVVPCLFTDKSDDTGACIMLYKNDVRENIFSFRKINLQLDYDKIDIKKVLDSSFVFFTGWSFLPSSLTSNSCIRLMKIAKVNGIPIIFDILPHRLRPSEITEEYRNALLMADILIAESDTYERIFNNYNSVHITNNAKLYLLFDWVKSFKVIDNCHNLLYSGLTNYSHKSEPYHLDRVAIENIIRFYNKSYLQNPTLVTIRQQISLVNS